MPAPMNIQHQYDQKSGKWVVLINGTPYARHQDLFIARQMAIRKYNEEK